jgi:hypothetical protein
MYSLTIVSDAFKDHNSDIIDMFHDAHRNMTTREIRFGPIELRSKDIDSEYSPYYLNQYSVYKNAIYNYVEQMYKRGILKLLLEAHGSFSISLDQSVEYYDKEHGLWVAYDFVSTEAAKIISDSPWVNPERLSESMLTLEELYSKPQDVTTQAKSCRVCAKCGQPMYMYDYDGPHCMSRDEFLSDDDFGCDPIDDMIIGFTKCANCGHSSSFQGKIIPEEELICYEYKNKN